MTRSGEVTVGVSRTLSRDSRSVKTPLSRVTVGVSPTLETQSHSLDFIDSEKADNSKKKKERPTARQKIDRSTVESIPPPFDLPWPNRV
jgi:hypothetical protein